MFKLSDEMARLQAEIERGRAARAANRQARTQRLAALHGEVGAFLGQFRQDFSKVAASARDERARSMKALRDDVEQLRQTARREQEARMARLAEIRTDVKDVQSKTRERLHEYRAHRLSTARVDAQARAAFNAELVRGVRQHLQAAQQWRQRYANQFRASAAAARQERLGYASEASHRVSRTLEDIRRARASMAKGSLEQRTDFIERLKKAVETVLSEANRQRLERQEMVRAHGLRSAAPAKSAESAKPEALVATAPAGAEVSAMASVSEAAPVTETASPLAAAFGIGASSAYETASSVSQGEKKSEIDEAESGHQESRRGGKKRGKGSSWSSDE